MSSEGVKQLDCWKCGATCLLDDIADADGQCPRCDAEMDLAGYLKSAWSERDALVAECERLRQAATAALADRAAYKAISSHRHRCMKAARAERNALSAELAALKAASGEEVEVVGYRSGTSGLIYETAYDLQQPQELMPVAQHQRITAALRGEVEQFKQANRELSESNVKRRDEWCKLRAELDAIRKQEPVKLSDDVREYLQEGINSATQCEDEDMDYDFANELGKLLGTLYAAPPAAAMGGGMVPVKLEVLEAAEHWLQVHSWPGTTEWLVADDIGDAISTHRQASQQEGE